MISMIGVLRFIAYWVVGTFLFMRGSFKMIMIDVFSKMVLLLID